MLDAGIDCAVITTAHDGIDYADVARRSPVVVDTRNVLQGVEGTHIFRLCRVPGLPFTRCEAEDDTVRQVGYSGKIRRRCARFCRGLGQEVERE